ncbi:Na(+)/H(+) antiporter subunit D [Parvibaculum sp.]|uniref:Na(+)/H(+) antiporter subunit D n=1 Tax=Parvibaculum sp. TaxID=2024848 RepID=UPI003BAC5169
MPELLTPATLYIAAAILLPFLPKGLLRQIVCVLVPFAGVAVFWSLPPGTYSSFNLMGLHVGLMQIDDLSRIFGLIFSIAAVLAAIYAWHVRDTIQQVAGLLYAGSAIGAVFAADLVSLFVFWEGTAIASVFLIWARRTEGAYAAGMRYLIVQISSGVVLMAGVILLYRETGSVAFGAMELGSLATWMIFIAFGVKCAFPLLHNWMHDAYPSATVSGTVILSVFTTKLAVYALLRGFPGTELLIYIGAAMALFPVFFALLENDLRRVLTYSLNSQLGFMVVGAGIGTPLAINGAVAHAICSILYQALLFMSIGAVLYRTGTARASALGGLYRTMPLTMFFCLVGGASISAFPLLSGFVSKSLILSASGYEEYFYIWLILLFASIGAFVHTGLRLPWLAFFGSDSGKRPKEAPAHMNLAMGLTALLCAGIGGFPAVLYGLLPNDVAYEPYTLSHIVTQLQLLAFVALGFAMCVRFGLLAKPERGILLDSDWIYRKFFFALTIGLYRLVNGTWKFSSRITLARLDRFIAAIYRTHGPQGPLARTWPTGSMVLWMAVLLGMTLVLAYI